MYVDNLLLPQRDTPLLKDVKRQLMGGCTMADMGDVSMVLGMRVSRDREATTLTISQQHYTRSVHAPFGIANTTQFTRRSRNGVLFFWSSWTRC